MSTTAHPVAPEEVMAFLDGELTAEHTQSLSAHIESCAECSEAAAAYRRVSRSLSNWTVTVVPTQLELQIRSASQKTSPPTVARDLNGFLHIGSWVRKHWVLALGASGTALVSLFAVATSNFYRTKMAANEASPISQARARETARVMTADDESQASSNAQGTARLEPHGDAVVSGHVSTEAPPPPPPAAGRTLSFETHSAGPMIARTVSLSIVVKDFDASRAMLDTILARHNGYAAELNVATPQGAARALQGSLRIPAPQLVAAVAELKALGRVEVETQNGEEVTQQHADLVARLKNSRETEQRLQDVLRTRTGKVKDVLEVEEEIARVRGEIEQMEAEQQNLEHRVSFATVDLKLAEEYKAQLTSPAPSAGMQLRNAIVNGFRNASESLLSIILFFAEAGPTLVLWLAILFLPARLLWRRYQRAYATSGSSLGA